MFPTPRTEFAFYVAYRVHSIGFRGACETIDRELSRREWDLLWTMVEAIIDKLQADAIESGSASVASLLFGR